MSEVVFVDSSVLYNLLDVPQKNSDRAEIVGVFRRLVDTRATLIFPMTAVVETGNTIAQLAGAVRYHCAERFVGLLRYALETVSPWAVSGVAWDQDFLRALVEGGAHGLSFVEFANTGIGSGDACLLLEMERYRRKVPSATPIRVWTLDAMLSSYG